jgi:hypothetical protein
VNPVSGTWLVAVECPAGALGSLMAEIRRSLVPYEPDGEDDQAGGWTVVAGTGRHSAVRGDDPSGEDALLVAEALSHRVPGSVYAIVIPEPLRGVYLWQDGVGRGEVGTTPEGYCCTLGLPPS